MTTLEDIEVTDLLTRSPAAAWLLSIMEAADDLGYSVVEIGVKHARLVPIVEAHRGTEVTVTGHFTNGDELKRILRPLRDAAS